MGVPWQVLGWGLAAVLGVNIATGGITTETKSYTREDFEAMRKEQRKNTKQHRCNDRIEDLVQALADEDSRWTRDVPPAAKLLWRCIRSEEGLEPADPYVLLRSDNKAWKDHSTRRQAAAAGADLTNK